MSETAQEISARAYTVSDDQWTVFEDHFFHGCCDCGLSHRVDLRRVGDSHEIRFEHLSELTKQSRVDHYHPLHEELCRLRAENQRLQSACEHLQNKCLAKDEEINCAGVTNDKLQAGIARLRENIGELIGEREDLIESRDERDAEIALLSSPPEERMDIVERQETRRQLASAGYSMDALEDIDTLLQDAARWRNAHCLLLAERDAARERITALENKCALHAASEKKAEEELADANAYISRLPADWFKDSSLETWFPLTATMLQQLQSKLAAYETCLTQVRQEMPLMVELRKAMESGDYDNHQMENVYEVLRVIHAHALALQQREAARLACALEVSGEHPEIPEIKKRAEARRDDFHFGWTVGQNYLYADSDVHKLLGIVDKMLAHEAANRNAIAVHLATIADLQHRLDLQHKQVQFLEDVDSATSHRLNLAESMLETAITERDAARDKLSNIDTTLGAYINRERDYSAKIAELTIANEAIHGTMGQRIEQLESALREIASNKTRHMEVNHAFCVNTAASALAAADGQDKGESGND